MYMHWYVSLCVHIVVFLMYVFLHVFACFSFIFSVLIWTLVCALRLSADVPEGCVIIKEHIPITNLFTCNWFNEVDRFTSRDQLSFSTVRDKIMGKVNWSISMFLDCERRNFVIQVWLSFNKTYRIWKIIQSILLLFFVLEYFQGLSGCCKSQALLSTNIRATRSLYLTIFQSLD